MRFTKSGGRTAVGPEDWFTGTVYIDSIRNPDEQSCVGLRPRAVHPRRPNRMAHPPPRPDPLRHRRHRVCRPAKWRSAGNPSGRCRVL